MYRVIERRHLTVGLIVTPQDSPGYDAGIVVHIDRDTDHDLSSGPMVRVRWERDQVERPHRAGDLLRITHRAK